jgi:hypothetical protein
MKGTSLSLEAKTTHAAYGINSIEPKEQVKILIDYFTNTDVHQFFVDLHIVCRTQDFTITIIKSHHCGPTGVHLLQMLALLCATAKHHQREPL